MKSRRAFTLVELLVSIVVLLAIILATARIFASTTRVASLGEATADMQAMSTAIERSIRADIARMDTRAFLLVQCVAVRNNLYADPAVAPPRGPLIDPSLAADEFVRCDQVVFLARGAEGTRSFEGSGSYYQFPVERFTKDRIDLAGEGVSLDQVIRLGHGIQYPQMITDPRTPTERPEPGFFTYPVGPTTQGPPTPWMWQRPGTPFLDVGVFDSISDRGSGARAFVGPLDARKWTLVRQSTLLADDGGSVAQRGNFLFRRSNIGTPLYINSAPGLVQRGSTLPTASAYGTNPANASPEPFLPDQDIFPDRYLLSGRIDIAATDVTAFRQLLETPATNRVGETMPWTFASRPQSAGLPNATQEGEVRTRLLNAFFGGGRVVANDTNANFRGLWCWPRGEVDPVGSDRLDVMTAASTMAGSCSSFRVEWTWKPGTARVERIDGTPEVATALPDSGRATVLPDVPLAGVMLEDWPGHPDLTNSEVPLDDNRVRPHVPWFGLPDSLFPASQRAGVTTLAGGLLTSEAECLSRSKGVGANGAAGNDCYATPIRVLDPARAITPGGTVQPSDLLTVAVAAPPIDAERIEGAEGPQRAAILRPFGDSVAVYMYRAAFGFNGTEPVARAGREQLVSSGGTTVQARTLRSDYTPWPTALRFTYTLHDSRGTLATGRTFQFVVELPRPEKS